MDTKQLKNIIKDLLISLGTIIPYRYVSAMLSWFCRQRWLIDILMPGRVALIRELIVTTGNEECTDEIIQQSMVSNLLGTWRLLAISRLPKDEHSRWVTFKNQENLTDNYDTEHGLIIVNSHFGLTRYVPMLLSKLGYDTHSLEASNLVARLKMPDARAVNVIEVGGPRKSRLRQAYLANKALQSGSLLHLAADGFYGDSGMVLPFLGKARRYASGFADLAVRSGAKVVPVFASVAIDGVVTIEFMTPLDAGNESTPAKERIDNLIRQYAGIIEQRWHDNLGDIRWVHLGHFKRLSNDSAGPELIKT